MMKRLFTKDELVQIRDAALADVGRLKSSSLPTQHKVWMHCRKEYLAQMKRQTRDVEGMMEVARLSENARWAWRSLQSSRSELDKARKMIRACNELLFRGHFGK